MYLLSKDYNKFFTKVLNYYKRKHQIENLYQACENIFPGKWSVLDNPVNINDAGYSSISNFVEDSRLKTSILIHFPEVIIKGNSIKHLITDLYVKMEITLESNFLYISLQGIRSSRTIEELQAGYVHSHLNATRSNNFNQFCLGNGPLNKLKYLSGKINDIQDWEYYLYLIDSFIQWESKSGVPFIFMESIGNSNVEEGCPNYVPKNILMDNIFKDIKYKIKNNKIEVIPTEALEKDIFNVIKENSYSAYLCTKTNDGKYVRKNTIDSTMDYLHLENEVLFHFNNEPVKFKISNKQNIQDNEYNVPNPAITKGICKVLSKNLTKAQIERGIAKQKDKSSSTQESCESSSMVV